MVSAAVPAAVPVDWIELPAQIEASIQRDVEAVPLVPVRLKQATKGFTDRHEVFATIRVMDGLGDSRPSIDRWLADGVE